MKKTITAVIILLSSFAAEAEDSFDPFKDRQLIFDITNIIAILTVVYMISSFILQIIRQNFDYRIKSKVIEKGTSENIVQQLVQPNKKNPRNTLVQWFFILAGIALGFTIINLTRPFGLHSLAIMAFCIAAGFAGAYFFIRRSDK
jgi:1,4-dihydroxy-2-naphthoate octaprenyltransferase